MLLEPRQNETIDSVLRPVGVGDRWQSRFPRRLETPPFSAGMEHVFPVRARFRVGGRWLVSRIRCAVVHPFHEVGDHGVRQLRPFQRHPGISVVIRDHLDEQALAGVTRDERRTGVAALEQAVARIDPQAALLLFGAVAFVAFAGKEGSNPLLEKFNLARRGFAGGTLREPQAQECSIAAKTPSMSIHQLINNSGFNSDFFGNDF